MCENNSKLYSTYKHQQIAHQLNLFHLNHTEASLKQQNSNFNRNFDTTNKILLKHILKKENWDLTKKAAQRAVSY